jgi:hypothetical protein
VNKNTGTFHAFLQISNILVILICAPSSLAKLSSPVKRTGRGNNDVAQPENYIGLAVELLLFP